MGAGLRDCWFWAIIVGGTRPYRMYEFLHFSFRLFEQFYGAVIAVNCRSQSSLKVEDSESIGNNMNVFFNRRSTPMNTDQIASAFICVYLLISAVKNSQSNANNIRYPTS
ncbi:MAG TPA: hypothetical protein DCS91_16015 [Microcoleaceae bacterium UBA11344]|nr:hypothetical protein [Microcoleaceae cyanobacterium UBA11344]